MSEFTPWPAEFAAQYRAKGYWRGETFGSFLRERARYHGERTALVDGSRRWSYAGLDAWADRLAAGLHEAGIRAGDRVVVQLPNQAEFVALCFGLFRLGGLPIFALPGHRHAEIGAFCQQTNAVAYVITDRHSGFDYRDLARRVQRDCPSLKHIFVAGEAAEFRSLESIERTAITLPEPASGTVALFQLSGGSTGISKLIPRTHDDYIYSLRASADICRVGGNSVYLCALPAPHNFSLSSPGILGTLYAGGTVVLARHPSPDHALPLIAREGVTISAVVPPLLLIWLEAAASGRYDLSTLQVLQVGGAKLSAEVAQRVTPTLGCTLQQVYGMAEGLVNYTRLDDSSEQINHTQGRPISPDDELRIVDEFDNEVAVGELGELLTRGPYTIRGYYATPEHNARAFTADGFYRTGDLVRRTPEGYLSVEGRVKDQINRGGEKVAAEEVESHLLTHPAIHDAALVAIPDAILGEKTCAFIVARGIAPTRADIAAFLRERGLAAYKIPDRVQTIDGLPKTNVGKIDKRALRKLKI